MSLMDAQRRNASALRLRHSQSFASRRHLFSHAKVRSTIQRFGSTTNVFAVSERFDDLDVDLAADPAQSVPEPRALIAAIRIELHQEWMQPEHHAREKHAAVTVLKISGMDNGKQQEALRIYRDMPLLAFDLLARVIAVRIDAGPPFSALLTLWLSIIAAVGLASRSANSRHRTYSA